MFRVFFFFFCGSLIGMERWKSFAKTYTHTYHLHLHGPSPAHNLSCVGRVTPVVCAIKSLLSLRCTLCLAFFLSILLLKCNCHFIGNVECQPRSVLALIYVCLNECFFRSVALMKLALLEGQKGEVRENQQFSYPLQQVQGSTHTHQIVANCGANKHFPTHIHKGNRFSVAFVTKKSTQRSGKGNGKAN